MVLITSIKYKMQIENKFALECDRYRFGETFHWGHGPFPKLFNICVSQFQSHGESNNNNNKKPSASSWAPKGDLVFRCIHDIYYTVERPECDTNTPTNANQSVTKRTEHTNRKSFNCERTNLIRIVAIFYGN